MFAVAVSVELHLPASRSLKDKRRMIKSLSEKIAKRYRASVAEVAHHDLRQRAGLGLALVTRTAGELETALDAIRSLFETEYEVLLTDWRETYLEGHAS